MVVVTRNGTKSIVHRSGGVKPILKDANRSQAKLQSLVFRPSKPAESRETM